MLGLAIAAMLKNYFVQMFHAPLNHIAAPILRRFHTYGALKIQYTFMVRQEIWLFFSCISLPGSRQVCESSCIPLCNGLLTGVEFWQKAINIEFTFFAAMLTELLFSNVSRAAENCFAC
jgi:hypothetical protein